MASTLAYIVMIAITPMIVTGIHTAKIVINTCWNMVNIFGQKKRGINIKVFIVTDKGKVVPCSINKGVIRPTIKGGYRILRLAHERKEKQNG